MPATKVKYYLSGCVFKPENFLMLRFRSLRYIPFGFLLSLMLVPSCGKDKDYDEIPFAHVNIYINPNSTFYYELNNQGGWIYLVAEKPSRGILVYRVSQNEFMAYERTCPYDPLEPDARIEVEASHITTACPVCESKFILLDGTPFDGPARRPLKQYRTSYNGNMLHIYN